MMKILVVHGPNLNLLGEAPGDRFTLRELDARLEQFAAELGATLKIVQSNHEGVLLDAIQAERGWADAVLINPSALTHTSYALRECLRLLRKPVIEVHLEDIRRRETWRRKSVIKDVCEAQVMGRGLFSYLDGLERLVTGRFNGLRKGRAQQLAASEQQSALSTAASTSPAAEAEVGAAAAATVPPAVRRPTKTIGRAPPSVGEAVPSSLLRGAANAGAGSAPLATAAEAPAAVAKTIGRARAAAGASGSGADGDGGGEVLIAAAAVGITRGQIRERIAERLNNRLSAGGLASWAREQWLNLERGGAAEVGQRELLEEVLQTLAMSATAAGQLGERDLIDWMARLA